MKSQCSKYKRSLALQRADVIVLLGARLNWMLHFGLPPRFAKDVAFIQVDINAEELTRGLALQGKFYNTLKICTKFLREINFKKFFVKLISRKLFSRNFL